MTETAQFRTAGGTPVEMHLPKPPGRALAANSRPAVLSNEDFAVLNDVVAKLVLVKEAIEESGGSGGGSIDISALVEAIENIPNAATTLAPLLDGLETLLGTSNTNTAATKVAVEALNAFIDGIEGLLGTANTNTAAIQTAIATLTNAVDGLETLATTLNGLVTSSNGKLDDLKGFVDTLETLVGSTNTALGTLAGHVDGLETLIGTTNATLTTLNSYIDGLEGVFGTTAGAAVVTDVAATIQQYLRGVVVLLAGGLKAGEQVIGKVGGTTTIVDVTLTLTASAHTAGQVLAATQAVTNAMRVNGGTGTIQNIVVVNQDDSDLGLDLVFFETNVTLGTEVNAPSISDADATKILTIVEVPAGKFKDYGANRTADINNLSRPVQAASGSRDIHVGAILTSGAPTPSANGIRLKIAFYND